MHIIVYALDSCGSSTPLERCALETDFLVCVFRFINNRCFPSCTMRWNDCKMHQYTDSIMQTDISTVSSLFTIRCHFNIVFFVYYTLSFQHCLLCLPSYHLLLLYIQLSQLVHIFKHYCYTVCIFVVCVISMHVTVGFLSCITQQECGACFTKS